MASRQFQSSSEIADVIWSLAERPRGDFEQSEYGEVIPPLTVLRRLHCVLEPAKGEVVGEAEGLEDEPIE